MNEDEILNKAELIKLKNAINNFLNEAAVENAKSMSITFFSNRSSRSKSLNHEFAINSVKSALLGLALNLELEINDDSN